MDAGNDYESMAADTQSNCTYGGLYQMRAAYN